MGMLSGMQKNDLKMEKCVVSKPYNPEEKCEQLVENIKLLCKERAISYYALAQKADISTSALHSMMTGKTNLTCIRFTNCVMRWKFRFRSF